MANRIHFSYMKNGELRSACGYKGYRGPGGMHHLCDDGNAQDEDGIRYRHKLAVPFNIDCAVCLKSPILKTLLAELGPWPDASLCDGRLLEYAKAYPRGDEAHQAMLARRKTCRCSWPHEGIARPLRAWDLRVAGHIY